MTAITSPKKPDRTPLGLPCLLPRSTYKPIDVFAAVATTVIVPLLLESDALHVYMAAALFHDVLIAFIDYDENNSSLFKRWTGFDVAINLKYMFCYDCLISLSHFYFPFRLKGFSVWATKVIFWGFGVTPLPALAVIDWGSSAGMTKKVAAGHGQPGDTSKKAA
jgi:hypothetical protein